MRQLKVLRVLSLRNNQLGHIGGLEHLKLQELYLSNNKVYIQHSYIYIYNITSFFGSSYANNGKDALNTPDIYIYIYTTRLPP